MLRAGEIMLRRGRVEFIELAMSCQSLIVEGFSFSNPPHAV